jgi:hypothetical protein
LVIGCKAVFEEGKAGRNTVQGRADLKSVCKARPFCEHVIKDANQSLDRGDEHGRLGAGCARQPVARQLNLSWGLPGQHPFTELFCTADALSRVIWMSLMQEQSGLVIGVQNSL